MISKEIKVSINNHLLGYFDLLNKKGYGKATIKTTEIYTHVTKNGLQKISLLLDALDEDDEK